MRELRNLHGRQRRARVAALHGMSFAEERPELVAIAIVPNQIRPHQARSVISATGIGAVTVDAFRSPHFPSAIRGDGVDHVLVFRSGGCRYSAGWTRGSASPTASPSGESRVRGRVGAILRDKVI